MYNSFCYKYEKQKLYGNQTIVSSRHISKFVLVSKNIKEMSSYKLFFLVLRARQTLIVHLSQTFVLETLHFSSSVWIIIDVAATDMLRNNN
ncbi:hypothetical protein Lal_00029135 [Lupinus albus]|nr:hypothetical protein Lal_00029135 [Lupinus albus]